MKRILSLVLAILVYCMSITSVLGALFPTATVVASAATTDNASKRLKLSSNTTGARYHVDQNGNPVNLFGMARCQGHATEEELRIGGEVNTLARHYADLGMNYMRLAINVRGIIGKTINDPLQLTTDAEIDAWIKTSVDPDVKAIIGEGMYVGLDLHQISITGVDDAKKLPADKVDKYVRANYLPILKRLTNYYKNEPMIANVEIWNEPSIGVPTGTNGVGWRDTLRNFFLDTVKELRKIDSTRIIMVSDDNAGWGWNINSFWTKDLINQLGNNIVFSSHVCHDQFDAGSNHDYSHFGNNFIKAVANSNNICIFLNEIENEPGTSTDQSIINLCKFFEENKSTYHFAGCLWRPQSHYADRTRIWGTNGWAASYTGKPLKLPNTVNWFKADGANSKATGGELITIPANGNEVKVAGTSVSFDAEYAKVQNASGEIIFTKNKYNSTALASHTPTDLAGYEYVIVKLKFASQADAQKALNATSNNAFITVDGGATVSFANYKSALQANAERANAGELVTLVLPLSKKLDSCYRVLSMKPAAAAEIYFYTIDFATAAYAQKVSSSSGSLYNVKTVKTYVGPTYTLKGSQWTPQLAIGAAERIAVSRDFSAIKMDITLPDYATLADKLSWGSSSSLGGGSFTYHPESDLGIYFIGQGIEGIGVTKTDFINALNEHKSNLSLGKTATIIFPISGKFVDGSVVESIQFMFAHGDKATAFGGKSISVSNIEFVDSTLFLTGNSDYSLNGNMTKPQLTVDSTNTLLTSKDFNYVKFSLKIPDIVKLRDAAKVGSGSTVGGGSFSYDATKDLALYFNGTNVEGVGVTQAELFDVFNQYQEEFEAGETLYLTLPLSGSFSNDGSITGINLMLSNGNAATGLKDIEISLSDIEFISNTGSQPERVSTAPEAVIPSFKLQGEPNFTFSGNYWDPQLTVKTTEEFKVPADTLKVQFEIKIPDYNTLRPLMSWGSRSTLGGGSFSYGGNDLGIYFGGTGVSGVGITQSDLFAAFDANSTDLSAGKLVTLTLPLKGTLGENATITDIRMMVAHDSKASTFAGKAVSISNFSFITPDHSEVISDGPDFKFSGSDFYPQLTISTNEPYAVNSDIYKVRFDIKMPDYATLRPLMSWGSRENANGGSFGYGPTDLGIYFEGTSYIGVTQGNLFAAFDDNATALSAGETVTLSLPITGTFEDDDIITAVKFMITHGSNAASFSGKSVSISNFEFILKTENNILSDGPKYKFTGSTWWPQLTVKTTEPVTLTSETRRIKFDIRIPDYEELRPFMTLGSRETAGGGSFSYGGNDLGIYFTGNGVSGVGVTQGNLFAAFDANKEALSQGKRVTLTLPISGNYKEGDVITALNIMITHDANASKFSNKFVAISNVELLPFEYDKADLDCDENITAADIIIIKKLLFATDVTVANKNAGDVNGDGVIDICDYVILYEKVLAIS